MSGQTHAPPSTHLPGRSQTTVPAGPATAPPEHDLWRLQRLAGNRAIAQLIGTGALRRDAGVSRALDLCERDADRIAAGALLSGVPATSRTVMPKVPAAPAVAGGRPLEPAVRSAMEPRFGYRFERVLIHDASDDREAAAALSARAFTIGGHIWLGSGERSDDLPLIAHELAHVVQSHDAAFESAPPIRRLPMGAQPVMPTAGRPAPVPTVTAPNPLIDAMTLFAAIRPSTTASGVYEGVFDGRSFTIDQAKYEALRRRVMTDTQRAIERAQRTAASASDRYAEQQKVDAQHWIVAPIVKGLSGVTDPGPSMQKFGEVAQLSLAEAIVALRAGDYVSAARLMGDGEAAAQQASKMVLAYVDQIIDGAEMTVTVLEGVKLASELVFFACAVAATGGAAGAAATALGLEGAGAATTLFGVSASTATWATAIGAGAAITEQVALGIMRAAEGDKVDWGQIATQAAIQVLLAKFSPGAGQRLSKWIGQAAIANPTVGNMVVRWGMARVVTVATSVLMQEGSQIFSTVIGDTVTALRGQNITWAIFAHHLFSRLADPKALLMATVAGLLGGAQPQPNREPVGPAPQLKPLPKRSKSDTMDMRDINRELGLPKPRTKLSPAQAAPPGHKQVTAEEAFRPTPAEANAAVAQERATKPPLTDAGTPVRESTTANPRGPQFQAASVQRGTKAAFAKTIRADVGETQAYKRALAAGEYGLEQPQGANVPGRADFITARRDASGKMWIIANDAKTRSSSGSSFPDPKPALRPGWDEQVRAAVERANVGDAKAEAEMRVAYKEGRVWVRQVNVDLTPVGQGATSGVDAPLPVPWGALLPRPDDNDDRSE